jgi:hypothetical protein
MLNRWIVFLLFTVAVPLTGPVTAQEWGSLQGRFVYAGKPPEPKKLIVDKDKDVCCKQPIYDESLVVGKDGGIANIVIYVRTKNVKCHPDLAKSVKPTVVFDNLKCRFEPHILIYWKDKQKLILSNSDPVAHNVNIQPFGDKAINPVIVKGMKVEHRLVRSHTIPIPVTCNLHPWMKGYILPRENPYAVITDKEGAFKIENLPVGELEFQAWHEKAGYLALPNWKRGRFKVTIKEGVHDLGEIKVDPMLFRRK